MQPSNYKSVIKTPGMPLGQSSLSQVLSSMKHHLYPQPSSNPSSGNPFSSNPSSELAAGSTASSSSSSSTRKIKPMEGVNQSFNYSEGGFSNNKAGSNLTLPSSQPSNAHQNATRLDVNSKRTEIPVHRNHTGYQNYNPELEQESSVKIPTVKNPYSWDPEHRTSIELPANSSQSQKISSTNQPLFGTGGSNLNSEEDGYSTDEYGVSNSTAQSSVQQSKKSVAVSVDPELEAFMASATESNDQSLVSMDVHDFKKTHDSSGKRIVKKRVVNPGPTAEEIRKEVEETRLAMFMFSRRTPIFPANPDGVTIYNQATPYYYDHDTVETLARKCPTCCIFNQPRWNLDPKCFNEINQWICGFTVNWSIVANKHSKGNFIICLKKLQMVELYNEMVTTIHNSFNAIPEYQREGLKGLYGFLDAVIEKQAGIPMFLPAWNELMKDTDLVDRACLSLRESYFNDPRYEFLFFFAIQVLQKFIHSPVLIKYFMNNVKSLATHFNIDPCAPDQPLNPTNKSEQSSVIKNNHNVKQALSAVSIQDGNDSDDSSESESESENETNNSFLRKMAPKASNTRTSDSRSSESENGNESYD
jgi:hypothetical protein